MKKKLLIVCTIVIILLAGCTAEKENNKEQGGDEPTMGARFESGTYHNKNWDEPSIIDGKSVVPDKETAARIGNAIVRSMQSNGAVPDDHILQVIFYDEVEEIWILSYWEDVSIYEVDPGLDFRIAIQKSNAEVLWIGYA